MLKRFLSYYKPHIKLLILDMLAALTISLIGMVYPLVTNKMLNVFIPEKMYGTIVIAGTIVLILYIVRMLLRYFMQYYGHVSRLIACIACDAEITDISCSVERPPKNTPMLVFILLYLLC